MKSKWVMFVGCSLGCFLGSLDFGIVNTAVPIMQKEMQASFAQMQWVMNAYILAFTMLVILHGRLADLWGRRLIHLYGIILFGIASLFAGISENIERLIFWRFIQGVASSAIIPSALSLINHAFSKNERGKIVGLWSSITGIGMACGPVVSGLIVGGWGWRWIFYINLPIAFIAVILLLVFKESKSNLKGKVDWRGVFCLALALFCLTSGFMKISIDFVIVGTMFLILFYVNEVRTKWPTIPFRLFANLTFSMSALVLFSSFFCLASIFFLVPLYLQIIRYETPYMAGLMLSSMTGGVVIFSPLAGYLVDRWPVKKIILVGLCLLLTGGVLQNIINATSSYLFIFASLSLLGLGYALARNPATAAGLGVLSSQQTGTVSGIMWTIQNMGSLLGIAITVTLFRRFYEINLTKECFLMGYKYAMLALCSLVFLTIVSVIFLMKHSSTVD